MATDNLFGDVISQYTREQALEDGVLVDLRQNDLDEVVAEAGIKFPVACTAEVFAECVDLTPAAERAGNNIEGRLWDVVWMLRNAIQRGGQGDTIMFQLMAVRSRVRPTRTTLKAVCGPGDNMEPVITIMFPDQD